jgi:hypothetical protein
MDLLRSPNIAKLFIRVDITILNFIRLRDGCLMLRQNIIIRTNIMLLYGAFQRPCHLYSVTMLKELLRQKRGRSDIAFIKAFSILPKTVDTFKSRFSVEFIYLAGY